jgi:transcriptional regulator with XRE-family HTH domain
MFYPFEAMKQVEILARIRQFRRSKGISQSAMAASLFMAIKTYQNMENGQTKIDIERLQRIAQVLNMPLTSFLGLDEEHQDHSAKDQLQFFQQLLTEKERYIARLEADLKMFESLLQKKLSVVKLKEHSYL